MIQASYEGRNIKVLEDSKHGGRIVRFQDPEDFGKPYSVHTSKPTAFWCQKADSCGDNLGLDFSFGSKP